MLEYYNELLQVYSTQAYSDSVFLPNIYRTESKIRQLHTQKIKGLEKRNNLLKCGI